ncbi:DUF1493 family protein [Klebsiella aerogenes]|nr:DUF1493 family protein [Klebsiella aerogenes]HDU2896644.1 DUF1493 family protein [Klebsiella aerogenes]
MFIESAKAGKWLYD